MPPRRFDGPHETIHLHLPKGMAEQIDQAQRDQVKKRGEYISKQELLRKWIKDALNAGDWS